MSLTHQIAGKYRFWQWCITHVLGKFLSCWDCKNSTYSSSWQCTHTKLLPSFSFRLPSMYLQCSWTSAITSAKGLLSSSFSSAKLVIIQSHCTTCGSFCDGQVVLQLVQNLRIVAIFIGTCIPPSLKWGHSAGIEVMDTGHWQIRKTHWAIDRKIHFRSLQEVQLFFMEWKYLCILSPSLKPKVLDWVLLVLATCIIWFLFKPKQLWWKWLKIYLLLLVPFV